MWIVSSSGTLRLPIQMISKRTPHIYPWQGKPESLRVWMDTGEGFERWYGQIERAGNGVFYLLVTGRDTQSDHIDVVVQARRAVEFMQSYNLVKIAPCA